MRDTRDRWRSRPPGPCRCRLRSADGLPHAQGAGRRCRALRQRRSSSTMICEAAGEEDALSDSGPLRPAFEKEVLTCDVRVSTVRILKHKLAPSATAAANLYRLADSEQRPGD